MDAQMNIGMPDWPPRSSAWVYTEGTSKRGSTGQLWEVRNRQWVRLEDERPSEPPTESRGSL